MPPWPTFRRQVGPVAVGGFGVSAILLHLYHLLTHDPPIVAAAFGVAIPTAFSAGLVMAAAWLATADLGGRSDQVGLWTVVGAVAAVGIGSVVLVFELARGVALQDPGYVLLIQATGGAMLGFVLGVYDVQRQLSGVELAAERETATTLGSRLTILNRVLRHDVRNRVNVIKGNAELIEGGTGDPVTVARTIVSEADALAALSERARQLEAALSKDDAERETVDVAELLTVKAHRARSEHGYAAIKLDVPEAARARVSPRFETAVGELIENAILHNPSMEPTVWLGAAVESTVVRVTVADDGPGIHPDEVAVLERGHETALEHASGIGLWLVNWIVTESGGSVDFAERDPTGSLVEVTPPRAPPPAGESAAATEAPDTGPE